jgi:hypothetical protein
MVIDTDCIGSCKYDHTHDGPLLIPVKNVSFVIFCKWIKCVISISFSKIRTWKMNDTLEMIFAKRTMMYTILWFWVWTKYLEIQSIGNLKSLSGLKKIQLLNHKNWIHIWNGIDNFRVVHFSSSYFWKFQHMRWYKVSQVCPTYTFTQKITTVLTMSTGPLAQDK